MVVSSFNHMNHTEEACLPLALLWMIIVKGHRISTLKVFWCALEHYKGAYKTALPMASVSWSSAMMVIHGKGPHVRTRLFDLVEAKKKKISYWSLVHFTM